MDKAVIRIAADIFSEVSDIIGPHKAAAFVYINPYTELDGLTIEKYIEQEIHNMSEPTLRKKLEKVIYGGN